MPRGTRKDELGSKYGPHARLLADGSTGYALLMLAPDGCVASWSVGAQRLLGYREDDILGEHFSRLFFRPEEVQRGEAEHELQTAEGQGLAASGRWYVRQDGTAFWGEGVTTPLRDASGALKGFAKLIRDLTAHQREHPEEKGMTVADLSGLQANLVSCRDFLLALLGASSAPGESDPVRP
jgi:PAS domain S-box-containing protein